MVKVTFEMSEVEIEMLTNWIETAVDLKDFNEQEKKTATLILEQLSKYL